MTFQDLSPTVLRQRYLAREIKPSDIASYVLDRLEDEDQKGVWISRRERKLVMDTARVLDNKIHEIEELPLYGLILSVKDCIDVTGEPTTLSMP